MTLIQKNGGVNLFVIKTSYLSYLSYLPSVSSLCLFLKGPNYINIKWLTTFRTFCFRCENFTLVLGFQLFNVSNRGYMWT